MEQDQAERDRSDLGRAVHDADPAVLGRLVEQHQHRLFRYLVVVCGDHSVAEDLFQETWLRVLNRRAQYDSRWRFESWLFGIARNLFIDHVRRKAPESLDALTDPDEGCGFEPVTGDPSPFDRAVMGERRERVARALARLPPAYREVLVLRFQDDFSLAEIASLVGAPLSTVKSRLYRGLGAYRRSYEEIGGRR